MAGTATIQKRCYDTETVFAWEPFLGNINVLHSGSSNWINLVNSSSSKGAGRVRKQSDPGVRHPCF